MIPEFFTAEKIVTYADTWAAHRSVSDKEARLRVERTPEMFLDSSLDYDPVRHLLE